MDIISGNEKPAYRGYGNTQFRYAMTYVVITFVVLFLLNIYCSETCRTIFNHSKQTSMMEKCELTSDKIASLDVINKSTVSKALSQMESLKVARLIVTDQTGSILYDSADEAVGSYALLPEILTAIEGNNVFVCSYRQGTMVSRAAMPIFFYDTMIGCVYMTDYDSAQGALIQSLQKNVLQITLVLQIIVTVFSIAFSKTFSRRLSKIMSSMRVIRNGDFTHKLSMSGNDELTVLANEFNDLTERLQTSEQKRRRFVSDASHELKTPLASIKLLTDSILQNDMDPETTREFVQDIGNEAERLNRMTAKLLSLTRVDGQEAADAEIIYMAPTVQRVTRMLTPMASQEGISIQLQLENDSPILILEDDLYQIVFNLMENGIKYNTPGGTLLVTLSRQEDNALLTVHDSGVGIPEDALSHIFERFFRVDKARSRATGGSGLGLSIVRAIILRNRGEITVSSEMGMGTTFRVTFPVFDTEVDKE